MADIVLSVFGLGHVGCVSAACLAARGHRVWGVDTDERRVDLLKQGRSPIAEPKLPELILDAWKAGLLSATTDAKEAIRESSMSFVCVGTPGTPTGEFDLGSLQQCVRAIGQSLQGLPRRHVVIIRSTVSPGTMERQVIPAIEAASGKKLGPELGIVFQPEFVREGRAVADFVDPPLRVVAASDQESFDQVIGLYGFAPESVIRMDFRSAEVLKLACNAFHAFKVTFANEMDAFCQAVGADSRAVMRALCADRKLNISPYYLQPGLSFGGACLGKDIRATVQQAEHDGLRLPLLESVLESNSLRLQSLAERIMRCGGRRISVLGLASKEGSDDLRGSQGIRLAQTLLDAGREVRLYDPVLRNGAVEAGFKDQPDHGLGSLSSLLCESVEQAIEFADVVILTNDDPNIRASAGRVAAGKQIIDLGRWATNVDCSNGSAS